jgi:aminopeptidase N
VAVGNYLCYKDTFRSISGDVVPIEIYANAATLPKVPGSFANLKTFIHTYEKRWGAHRWQRVGYVAVPFGGGAMEHATNIAYPQSSINGNTNSQDLISHELAHSWFGNLITCSTSQNMWINEGFARYGEYLCYEALDPTLQTYKIEIIKLMRSVLNSLICRQYALDDVPSSQTYNSSLVYDKGGVIAYALRNYMGDALFFSSITQFLNENQYKNVNSEEFFNKLSVISGIDYLHDFYLAWVHQPGSLNFNIDSIKHLSGNTYQVSFKQRLFHANNFANNNLVDVEFVSASGERYLVKKIRFSGENQMVEVEIPFDPVFWAVDPNFEIPLACSNFTETITKTGIVNPGSRALFKMTVNEITDESIIRIEHNEFAPTPAKNIHPNLVKISETHFWRIGFLKYSPMQADYIFTYNSVLEKELLTGYTKEDLVLLYRKDASYEWQVLSAIVSGTNNSGTVTASFLLSGEYTLGICDGICNNVGVGALRATPIQVYPNPTPGEVRITNYELEIVGVEVFDVYGRKQKGEGRKEKGEKEVLMDISHLIPGIYFIRIQTENGMVITKIIKN